MHIIDFNPTFDSVSHKYLDPTLVKVGVSRKSHSIFISFDIIQIDKWDDQSIRVNDTNGNKVYSDKFNVTCGVA